MLFVKYIRCSHCGYIGIKSTGVSGSLLVELSLLILTVIGFFFMIFPGLILLAIFLIYSSRRRRFLKCPKCDSKNPVKLTRAEFLTLKIQS